MANQTTTPIELLRRLIVDAHTLSEALDRLSELQERRGEAKLAEQTRFLAIRHRCIRWTLEGRHVELTHHHATSTATELVHRRELENEFSNPQTHLRVKLAMIVDYNTGDIMALAASLVDDPITADALKLYVSYALDTRERVKSLVGKVKL